MSLRTRDIAYLASIVDDDPGSYPRREIVLKTLQRAYNAAKTVKTPIYSIPVSTAHAEGMAIKQAEEADKSQKEESDG